MRCKVGMVCPSCRTRTSAGYKGLGEYISCKDAEVLCYVMLYMTMLPRDRSLREALYRAYFQDV